MCGLFSVRQMQTQMGGAMLVEIKEVKQCRNKAFGNFLLRGQQSALITVSLKLNDTVAEYSATVFHELMHLWVTILRSKGFRCTNTTEHKFINAAEDYVLKMARKHLKPRRE